MVTHQTRAFGLEPYRAIRLPGRSGRTNPGGKPGEIAAAHGDRYRALGESPDLLDGASRNLRWGSVDIKPHPALDLPRVRQPHLQTESDDGIGQACSSEAAERITDPPLGMFSSKGAPLHRDLSKAEHQLP